MPSKRLYRREGPPTKIAVKCWFSEGDPPKGCPNPNTCRYVHPSEPAWDSAPSANKLIRCNYYTESGQPKGKGCPASHCSFLHPEDPGWSQAVDRPGPPGPPFIGSKKGPGAQHRKPSDPHPPTSGGNAVNVARAAVRLKPKPGAGRCRFFTFEGEPMNGGCPWKNECLFVHPMDPEWDEPGGNYKTIRCAFVDGDGHPLHGGCKNPKNCSYLHPEDHGWESAPRLYKTSRCINFDDKGIPIGRGCPHIQCTYIHPSDREWDDAPKRTDKAFKSNEGNRFDPRHDRDMDIDRERERDRRRSPPRRGPSPPPRRWGGKEMPSVEYKDARFNRLDQKYPRRSRSVSPRRFDGRRGGGGGRRSPSPRRYDRRRGSDRRSPERGGRGREPGRRPPPRRPSRSLTPTRRGSPPYGKRRASPPDRRAYRERAASVSSHAPSNPEGQRLSPNLSPVDASMSVQVLADDTRYSLVKQTLDRAEEQLDEAERNSKMGHNAITDSWRALESLAHLFPLMSIHYEEGIYSPLLSIGAHGPSGPNAIVERAVELQRHINHLRELLSTHQIESAQSSQGPPTGPKAVAGVIGDRIAHLSTCLQRISTYLNVLSGGAPPDSGPNQPDHVTVKQEPVDVKEGDVKAQGSPSETREGGVIGKFWKLMGMFGGLKT